jgi:drug/metabolite transporter (DMT)-like permease
MTQLKNFWQNIKMPSAPGTATQPSLGWADGLLLATTAFWAFNFAIVKYALAELEPMVFNGLRMLLVTGLMLIIAPALGYSLKVQRRHLLYLIILGLVGNTAYQLFFILGLARTTAANSALILATVPAWVAMMGTLIGVERVKPGGWLGIGLSLVGIVLIVWGGKQQAQLEFGGATLLGDLLILGGTLCWSIYTIASRPMLRHYPAIRMTAFTSVVGVIPFILLSLPWLIQANLAAISLPAWSAIIYSGVFSITLSYLFWNYGVSKLGSARTAFYSNLTPPLALVAAWLLLGETMTWPQLIGGLLALIGVVLARRYTQPVAR